MSEYNPRKRDDLIHGLYGRLHKLHGLASDFSHQSWKVLNSKPVDICFNNPAYDGTIDLYFDYLESSYKEFKRHRAKVERYARKHPDYNGDEDEN